MNVFLVEKRSSLNEHRTSLALARFSTIYKSKGDAVYHIILGSKMVLPNVKPDKIIISMVFSYDVPYFIKFIHYMNKLYDLNTDQYEIGGTCTLYMKDMIEVETGIIPFTGCSKKLDYVIPDFNMYTNDSTYVFTMRACPNKCSFCIVNSIEPTQYTIENWKEQINLNAKHIYIMDNNILSAPIEHRKDVFGFLSEIANVKGTKIPKSRGKIRDVCFDGGLDWRNVTEENVELIKDIKFGKLKIAFDDVRYEKGFDKAMKLLLPILKKSSRGMYENVDAYVLYNCNFTKDTIEDTLYRIYKLRDYYNVNPYVMRFQPLDTVKYKSYISPYWDERDCIDIGRWCNNRNIIKRVPRFKHYVGRKEDKCISTLKDNERKCLESINTPEKIELDFSAGFKANLDVLMEELEKREVVLKKAEENFKQMSLFEMV